ncbi:RNA polymerase sigma factor [Thermomonospora catenispora]|uniref:RNA polymerase sigma factor n=1 Tax=Thermomonospora catenispora TaxID=2493090 RepID=UPI001120B18F|nr:sigma-70 family RNA polymerase sigma factor [Thermomonospora catenispora]TNY35270.1 sigma-70 family RNA polymerase sigma factor [Thermomonospora catenispora]
MNDHALVGALRSGDPVGPAALYDAYAERLYRYCRFRLPDEAARAALIDAFAAAGAHIHELADPGRLGPWLYALTRLECLRRETQDLPQPEESAQRLAAWRAIRGMPPMSRDVLELKIRHRLDIPELAAVVDLPHHQIRLALTRAHTDLTEALSAELLALQEGRGCARLAALLRGREGRVLPAALRRRLLEHARGCAACGARIPHSVAPGKVYALLPDPLLPPSLRERVLSRLRDPADRPRTDIAFRPDGFPRQPHPSPGPARPDLPHAAREGSGWGIVAVTAGTAALVLATTAVVWLGRGGGSGATGAAPADAPPAAGAPERPPADDGTASSPTWPLGAVGSSAPPTAHPVPPRTPSRPGTWHAGASNLPGRPARGALTVAPRHLDLGGGCEGTIELLAHEGPVRWRARTPSRIRLSRTSGALAAGQRIVLRLRVDRRPGDHGQQTVTFHPGGVQVVVTWRTIPAHPAPAPRPTPRPTRPDPPTRPAPHRPTGTAPTASPDRPGQGRPTAPPASSPPSPPPSSTAPEPGPRQPSPPPASGPVPRRSPS